MKFSIRGLIKAGVMVAACNVAFAQQTIEFNSLNRQNSFSTLYKGQAQYTDKINGVFTRPSGVIGKVPVMVIMHSSAGISEASTGAWSKYFLKMGIATFVVDSFNPRGFKSSAADQSVLTAAASVADALNALKTVAEIPEVDINRIGVIGFSRGADASIQSSYLRARNGVLGKNSPLKFVFHIGFYPSCARVGTTDGTPLLIFEGGRDDYHSLKRCSIFENTLKTKGANLEYVTYSDATHGFDIDTRPAFGAKAQVWSACTRNSLEDLDTLEITLDGSKVTMKEYLAYSKECMTLGVHREYNRAATDDAKQRVDQLVRKYFGM